MTLGVVVPNYNGVSLMRQYLPSVLKSAEKAGAAQVVVVDDCSTDDSCSVLQEEFPGVTILMREKNGGFGEAVNTGAKILKTDLMAVCMTDMELEEDCLLEAAKLFEDDEIFAVGFNLKTGENDCNSGVTALPFSRGLFHHHFPCTGNPPLFSEACEVAFAVGGAMIVRKDRFDEIGGFDPLFAPYGWEDIDLGWKAWKRGWKSVNLPSAVAWHQHPHTSVKSHADEEKRLVIEYRNKIIFVRSNVSDSGLIARHKLWMTGMLLKAALKGKKALSLGKNEAIQRISSVNGKGKAAGSPIVFSDRELAERLAEPKPYTKAAK